MLVNKLWKLETCPVASKQLTNLHVLYMSYLKHLSDKGITGQIIKLLYIIVKRYKLKVFFLNPLSLLGIRFISVQIVMFFFFFSFRQQTKTAVKMAKVNDDGLL